MIIIKQSNFLHTIYSWLSHVIDCYPTGNYDYIMVGDKSKRCDIYEWRWWFQKRQLDDRLVKLNEKNKCFWDKHSPLHNEILVDAVETHEELVTMNACNKKFWSEREIVYYTLADGTKARGWRWRWKNGK